MEDTNMKTAEEIKQGLAHCYGTEGYHRFSILSKLVLTDGAKYLADECQCYWLMDAIATHQRKCMQDPMLSEFQFWTLKVSDGSVVLTCERDTDDIAITQNIPSTDFPLDEVKLYVTNGVILLPSEY
jgi:hypothetical protein